MYNNLGKVLKKVIIIFLVIALTYSNFILVGSNLVKGLISYALDNEETIENKVILEQELVTNKVYEINGEEKRIIQIEIKSGIESENFPIRMSNITLKTDILENMLEDVNVTSLNKNSYTVGNWETEEGKLKISLINENEELEAKEKGLDKLLITYIYPNNEEIQNINTPVEKLEITTYENETIQKNIENKNFEDLNEKGDISVLNIENKDIHKTEIKEDMVEYTEKLNLRLGYRKETSNIIIEDIENELYKNEEKSEETKVKYNKTKIDKETLMNLLTQEGKLTIKDVSTDKTLVELTKEDIETQELDVKVNQSILDEEVEEIKSNVIISKEDIEIEYAVDVQKIKIIIENVKPQNENIIEKENLIIENTKCVYNINDLENLTSIKEEIKYTLGEKEKLSNSEIKLKDTITRAKLEVDNTNWEIGKANKVNYKITLDTKTQRSELYVNPLLILELPQGVENVNEENSEFTVKNDNGAFTKKQVISTSILGKKYAVIKLEGEQSEETTQNGNTEINLSLELNTKALQEQITEKSKLYYQNNEVVTAYESGMGFDTEEVDITFNLAEPKQEEIENNEIEEQKPEQEEPTGEDDEKISIKIDKAYYDEEDVVKQGEEYRYAININNNSEEKVNKAILKLNVPAGVTLKEEGLVKYKEGENGEGFTLNKLEYQYDDNTRILTALLPEILANGNLKLEITLRTELLEKDIYSKQIDNEATIVMENGREYKSNTFSFTVSDTFLEVKTNELPENLKINDIVTLKIEIVNKGLISALNEEYSINIPEEIEGMESSYEIINNTDSSIYGRGGATINGKVCSGNIIILPASHTYYLTINGIYKKSISEDKKVVITGTISNEEIDWETTLSKDDNPNIPDTPDNPNTPNTPDNPDNPNTPNTPDNPDNPDNPNTPNTPDTPDKPNNPDKPINPDDSNNSEKKEEFDLSLKQYLKKVIVTNTQGTTTYDYTNTNFAKVEIPAKYMNGSIVTFEYEITVKNEGTIPGYARKIVDYIPKDLTFNSELNKDWYLGDDGNLYSVALIDKLLRPGETANLKVVLTKQMNNNNTGTVTNIVEIYEASNEANVEDINSIPGDKLEGQNDMSKVEVIVAVRTGTIILYIMLAITVIAIITLGINKVKKITLNKKEVL